MTDIAADFRQLRGRKVSSATKPAPGERRRAAVLVTIVSDYSTLIEQLTPSSFADVVARIRCTATTSCAGMAGW